MKSATEVGLTTTRSVDDTWRDAGNLLDLFSPGECGRYLVSKGYAAV